MGAHSCALTHSVLKLETQDRFNLFYRNHFDGVPGAAVQEATIGSFTRAFLAANTTLGIDLDPAEGRVFFVGYPIHAVLNRTVGNAGRRSRTAGATLGDHGEFLGLLLTGGLDPLRLGLTFVDFTGRDVINGHLLTLSLKTNILSHVTRSKSMGLSRWALSTISVESSSKGAPSHAELLKRGLARMPRQSSLKLARCVRGRHSRGSGPGSSADGERSPPPSRWCEADVANALASAGKPTRGAVRLGTFPGPRRLGHNVAVGRPRPHAPNPSVREERPKLGNPPPKRNLTPRRPGLPRLKAPVRAHSYRHQVDSARDLTSRRTRSARLRMKVGELFSAGMSSNCLIPARTACSRASTSISYRVST